jgi:3-isopropylmalate/(R)-2-methylmalate dehydratase large subunit
MAEPQTMAEKILAAHAGLGTVHPGQLIECDLDLVLANDITAPLAIKTFEDLGVEKVFDNAKIALVPDHYAPNKDIKSAIQTKTMRDFAHAQHIVHYWEQGRAGIEHALLPEQGVVAPGDVIIGADSHTCTYGAVGAFATGVGSTDAGVGMATGQAWFRVPETIRVELTGELSEPATAKDVILTLIGMLGVDGARYQALEFGGPGLASISMDGRFSIANMAIEAGAKTGLFEVDETCASWVAAHSKHPGHAYAPDADAVYARTIELDLSQVVPVVAKPHLPENVVPAADLSDVAVDQVVIGSCTNGRMEDMRAAAYVLEGRTVHPDVRCIVLPATPAIYKQSMAEGLIDIFIDAGCVVSTPTCGPCLGGYMGILAPGEVAVSTTNRNFVGRMGHVSSQVYLASPAVCAESAVAGRIAVPRTQE